MTRLALPLALAVVAVLAGCSAVPTDQTTTPAGSETFEVELVGNSSATYVVSARLVADPDENITLTYANGTTRTISLPAEQSAVTYGPESEVTSVEVRNQSVGGVYFEGAPTFSVTDNDVQPTGNVVYTVRRKGEEVLAAWGLIRCDGHVKSLSLSADEWEAGGEPKSGVTGAGFGCQHAV